MARVLVTGASIGLSAFGLASSADAHVTVSADHAVQGGYAKLVLRVPDESETASTVKLTVTFPAEAPLRSARTKPVPGWTAKALLTTLPKPVKVGDITLTKAVTSITWTATAGQGIRPGEFQEFEISAGPLPTAVNSFVLPATQYYSDGETVRWDQPIPVGGKEPEYPAPSLSLAPASDPDSADATEATDDRQHAAIASAHDHPSTTSSTDWLARVLGAGGLLVGLAGAGVALWSRRRAGLAAS